MGCNATTRTTIKDFKEQQTTWNSTGIDLDRYRKVPISAMCSDTYSIKQKRQLPNNHIRSALASRHNWVDSAQILNANGNYGFIFLPCIFLLYTVNLDCSLAATYTRLIQIHSSATWIDCKQHAI